jgi:inorganic pyrophosphatase
MLSRAFIRRSFQVLTEGQGFEQRTFVVDAQGCKVSPWHDINLHRGSKTYHAVIEVSRHSIAKYEIATKEQFNPIKQDTRTNKTTGERELRYYAQFPLFNYGCLPQTWENSLEVDSIYPYKGDGDPLDIVEIGTAPLSAGNLVDVKVLGAMCLIDQGEADWKVICVNTYDPLSKKLNSPTDIEKVFPGKLKAIQTWFEEIKTYDGKPRNRFEGDIVGPEQAHSVIEAGHANWRSLRDGKFAGTDFWLGK